MESRCVLITGGGQGIGRAMVGRFMADGWRVGVLDIDSESGVELLGEPGAADCLFFSQGDVAADADVQRAVDGVVDRFGRLDALVNNAGCGCGGPEIEEWSVADWQRGLDVNLTGAFLCARRAVPHLRRWGGAIVNLASTRAWQSEKNTFSYSAAKGGLVALTHSLAVSLGPAIRVNSISPGWIETVDWKKASARGEARHSEADRVQHPCGRVGVPSDVAELAVFLADSAKSGFITGQDFVVDGGMTVKMIYV